MNKLKKTVYNNWKELCDEIGWKTTGGTYKKAREKELKTLCNYHKEGRKIIIDEIHDNPKPKIDKRKTTIENAKYFNEIMPELQKAMYKKDDKGDKILVKNICLTKGRLLSRIFGINTLAGEDCYKNAVFDTFHDYPISEKKRDIDGFFIEVSNFFWSKVLKNGLLDKLETFGKGRVQVISSIGIKTYHNNVENNEIITITDYKHLTEEEEEIVNKIKKDYCQRVGKRTTALLSKEERAEMYKLIANELYIDGDIFLYDNYWIDIYDSLDILSGEQTTKQYRDKIFQEFYKQHIEKFFEKDFSRFMIYTYLFSAMYGHKVSVLPPFDMLQKEEYEKEIRRLNEEIKEKDKRIAELEEENRRLREGLK